jgi:hypothetical protein
MEARLTELVEPFDLASDGVTIHDIAGWCRRAVKNRVIQSGREVGAYATQTLCAGTDSCDDNAAINRFRYKIDDAA